MDCLNGQVQTAHQEHPHSCHMATPRCLVMTAYHVGGTGIDDATPSSNIQHLVARLQLKGLQTGGMHVWCRHIEVQLLQFDRRVCEGFVLVLLGHKHVPWAHSHGLDGCVSAAAYFGVNAWCQRLNPFAVSLGALQSGVYSQNLQMACVCC